MSEEQTGQHIGCLCPEAELRKEVERLQAELAESRRGEEIIGGKFDDLLNESAALAAQVVQQFEVMKHAADQIRRCDYTPARSTLLEALTLSIQSAEEVLRLHDAMVIERCAKVCEPHDDDDKMDRQAKAECAAAIRKLAAPPVRGEKGSE